MLWRRNGRSNSSSFGSTEKPCTAHGANTRQTTEIARYAPTTRIAIPGRRNSRGNASAAARPSVAPTMIQSAGRTTWKSV